MYAPGGPGGNSARPSACHLGLASPDQILEDVLCEHTEYLHKFVDLFAALLDVDQPLPADERNYIGIMAACRHKCSVLVSEQRSRFSDSGGNSDWLQGLAHAPLRLRALHTANTILAHRPWMFNKKHIEDIVKSGMTLSETVHALTLMAYFHSMSSMLHAVGIEAASGEHTEIDYAGLVLPDASNASSSPRSSELAKGGVKVLLQRMEDMTGEGRAEGCSGAQARFEPSFPSEPPSTSELEPSLLTNKADDKYRSFSLYSPNLDFKYEDFYRRGAQSAASTLKYQHLWEEIGFSMLAKFTSQDLADAIDIKFKTAFNMTYNTCGSAHNVNTTPFRRAIWNYVQCLYGIRRDDYDYSLVNVLLDRHLKVFLKTMSVAPERLVTGTENMSAIMNDLRTSEQLHIVILASEARLQVEMVYAMLAVERYYM